MTAVFPDTRPTNAATRTPSTRPSSVDEVVEIVEVVEPGDLAEAELLDVIDDEDDEEEVAPREPSPYDRPGDWFVVHTYAGYENKVK